MTDPIGAEGGRRRFDRRPDRRRGPSAVAWLILGLGVVAAVAGAGYWDRTSERDTADRFDERADDVHDDVAAQLDRYNTALVATVGLFDASEVVTAPEFTLFADTLDLEQNYEGVAGLSFVVSVPTQDLDDFDAYLSYLEAGDVPVHPRSRRIEHNIVAYTASNGLEVGYDLASIDASRAALREARDSGETVASRFHSLPTEESDAGSRPPGFAIYAPVYQNGLPTETKAERRTALVGWVATPATRQEFVASAIDAPASLGVELVDRTGNVVRVPVQHPADLDEVREGDAEHVDQRTFTNFEREWSLGVESLPLFSSGSFAPGIVLGGGVVITFVLFGLVWALSHVSERRRIHAELTHQALHDPLTGLANRTLFLRSLDKALLESARRRRRITVMYIDLDHFKVVNDSLGHEAGDELLVETARRLESVLRSKDRAARLGGDEFAVLRDDIDNEGEALEAANAIAETLRVPYIGSDRDLFVPASIGVALSAPSNPDAAALLRNADLTMYRAKERGRDRYELFDDELRHQVANRIESETALHQALDNHEFVVFYQPEVEVANGRVVAVEALLRWWHPDLGPVAPADFIDIAEETGLIVPLGAWVLNEACRQAAAWRQDLGPASPPLMSVNLSARQVTRPDLATTIERALESAGLAPDALRLEITENVLMIDTRSSIETVGALRDLGVHLGIDDFGTGYSSLSYLQRFPVDTLKLDQSFVHALDSNEQSRAIVGSVISLAHSLDLIATAEGVETPAQFDELRALGCDHAQGNLFAPPQPAASLGRLFETTTRLGPVR
ncbi:MAG: putative bifunctional diguanylate cyclase/phosphodiesterase [Acidimicrobiia bacterium]